MVYPHTGPSLRVAHDSASFQAASAGTQDEESPAAYAGAVVRRITEIRAHPNADRLEIAMLGKFQTVVPRGAHAVGELVIFIEADTVLPALAWADEYRKYAEKRVKIVKLRGVFSEGVVVPITSALFDVLAGVTLEDGKDVSSFMKTKHYEPPISEPGAIGPLPHFLPKTDEERWEKVDAIPEGVPIYTLKVDGTSVTFLPTISGDGRHGGWRVFGRTLEYSATEPNRLSALLAQYETALNRMVELLGPHVALRGEAYGTGIQNSTKNPHSQIEGQHWVVYSAYDINAQRYLDFDVVKGAAIAAGVPSVATYEWGPLTEDLIVKIQEGRAITGRYEGIVVKYPDGSSFKILNKAYDGDK